MATPTLTAALSETLAVFESTGDPGEPLTTVEVTDRIDVSRRSTYARLERLVDAGHLDTKKAGARGRVWWRPPPAVGDLGGVSSDGNGAPVTDGPPTNGASTSPPSTNGSDDGSTPGDRSTVAASLVDDVLDRADVGVFILDADRRVAWINRATERYFGLDRSDVLGRDKRTLIEEQIGERVAVPESFAETVLATDDDNSDTEQFECRLTAGDNREERWLQHRSKPIEDGAYAGGRIELYYDITAQKQTERAHRESRRQFESLVDAVSEYTIFVLDPTGAVQTWNPGAERIKGYDAAEIVGEDLGTFYTPEDRAARVPERNLAAAARAGSIEREGWRVRADGSTFWANVTITAIRDDGGDLAGFAKVTRDMTERREYERRLERERDFTRQILETAPASIFVVREGGEVIDTNEDRLDDLVAGEGTDSQSIADIDVDDESGEYVPPDDRPFATVFETGQGVSDWRCQVDMPSGERRWLSIDAAPITGADGEVETVVVAAQNVSQLTEQARQLRRQRDDVASELQDVFTRVDDAFLAIDEHWRLTYVNEQAADMVNLSVEEMLGGCVWDVLPEVAEGRPRTLAEEAMATRETVEFEYYSEWLDVWVEARLFPAESGISAYFRDVTERKEREVQLEESRQRYRTLVEHFPNGAVALVDRDRRYVTVGGDPMTEPDVTAAELEGARIRDALPPEPAALLEPMYERALAGEAVSREAELGDRVYQFRFVPVRDEDGEVFAAMGMSQDVTEQTARERRLRETKAQLEAATEAGAVGTWEWHVEDDRFVAGATLARTFGVDPADAREGVSIDAFMSSIHAEDRERVRDVIAEALATCGEYEAEYRVRNADGDWRWVVARGRVECDEDGDPVTFPGAVTDITERKHAELELERQRERLAAINTLNAIVRDITDAVIEQSTRAEIERVVCEALAATDSYSFAWTGEVDVPAGEVALNAEAGVDGYLDGVSITLDPDDPRSEGPTGRAFKNGEIQTTRDVHTDDRHDPWRDHVETYDVRSSAAIPLVHEGTVYGVLNVYAERPGAFEGEERAVIGQLGEIVGHAIAAVERKHALMSDEVVELDFRIRNLDDKLGLDGSAEGHLELEETVPIGDGDHLVYGHASEAGRDLLDAIVDAFDHWQNQRLHDEAGATKFEVRLTEPPILSTLAALGGSIESATIADGNYDMTLHVSPSADVRRLIDAVVDAYPSAEMLTRRQVTRRDDHDGHLQRVVTEDLTDRQRSALRAAYHADFFAWPRQTNGKALADTLGVSPPTFHQHLRKAEQTVFDALLSDGDAGQRRSAE